MSPSDGTLVRAVRAGRREAFAELVLRWAPRVHALCRGRLGRAGPADDLTQEALLRALRSLDSLEDPERFGAWLHGIATRACLDWVKAKAHTQVSLGSFDDRLDPETASADAGPLEDAEMHGLILDAVNALPEKFRDAILLHYFHERSHADAASELGITPAAVNARLNKARGLLRQRLHGSRPS